MSGGTTTDAARYLRETAKLMRERADVYPSDVPWHQLVMAHSGTALLHAESWDPTVARAVADLLGVAAQAAEAHAAAISTSGLSLVAAALTVARTYRRELLP